jgi:hypothetical protein
MRHKTVASDGTGFLYLYPNTNLYSARITRP